MQQTFKIIRSNPMQYLLLQKVYYLHVELKAESLCFCVANRGRILCQLPFRQPVPQAGHYIPKEQSTCSTKFKLSYLFDILIQRIIK